jgi:hypothetical protein
MAPPPPSVPEPGTLELLGVGPLALLALRCRRRAKLARPAPAKAENQTGPVAVSLATGLRRARTVTLLIVALASVVACDAKGPAPSADPDIAGEWQSGASVYRITTSGTQVKAVFETVSPEADALGFKKGDLSFDGVRKGHFLQGEQVIRYPADNPCYKGAGRRLPFMALIVADGQRIVLDWYNIPVNPETCQDVGRTLGVTLLTRRGS